MPAQYFAWLKTQAIQAAEPPASGAVNAPFLSILMRTQGKRYEALKEALLSLEAQSDTDFEVILILHRAEEEHKKSTVAFLENLSPFWKERLTYRCLDTGTRAAPLNLALSMARGNYVTMFDDDDLVFEGWVENFHKAAIEQDGQAIRCYAMMQFWSADPSSDGSVQLQAVAPPEPAYCEPFDLQKHLSENYTPISCLAVPRTCYSVFGIAFDETLTTTEDWDFLMRCALLCGVYDTGEIMFLYRWWKNAESSHTLHKDEEWEKNRTYILEKLHQIPYVTTGKGCWPLPKEGDRSSVAIARRSFWSRLRFAYRKYGPWRFPFVMIRKVFYRLFG